MLYKKDYRILEEDEQERFDLAQAMLNRNIFCNLMDYHEQMPENGYHLTSYFPNNYVIFNYKKHIDCKQIYSDFKTLLSSNTTSERDILNFIKEKEAYFIIESLFEYYDFGHHDAYLFREFPLPPQYICDFLLIGKNSGGYEFIFIEFEHPNAESVLKDGDLGLSFRKGLKQIEDWETWLESNFSTLRNVFNGYRNLEKDLPSEFYEFDKSRIHFLVVSGKREHFKSKTYRLKRKSRDGVKIIHYDNLLDVCALYMKYNLKNVAQQ